MKQKLIFSALTLFALSHVAVFAQSNLEAYFEKFPQKNFATFSESHSRECNPSTNKLEGQLDIYTFTLKKGGEKLIEEIKQQYSAARSVSYRETWEESTNLKSQVQVYYSPNSYVKVGSGYKQFGYSCFKDPQQKGNRWIYVLEWTYGDSKNKTVKGRFFRAYSDIPSMRASNGSTVSVKTISKSLDGKALDSITTIVADANNIIQNLSANGIIVTTTGSGTTNIRTDESNLKDSAEWLSQFNLACRFLKKSASKATDDFWISKIYKLCQKADCLDTEEKALVKRQLADLRTHVKDSFLLEMLTLSEHKL